MGKSTKLTGDPSLARDHPAGASVELLQILAHDRFGTIEYVWPRHWVLHLNAFRRATDQLTGLHEQVLALPVDATDMRPIRDTELLGSIYEAGGALVVHAVLVVQHLCEEIERCLRVPPSDGDVVDRLSGATGAGDLAIAKEGSGYAAFIEVLKIRNALEHPKDANVYNGTPNGWDRVPLPWMISDRSLKAASMFDSFVCDLADAWEERRSRIEPEPATLEIGARGLRSERQSKKSSRPE